MKKTILFMLLLSAALLVGMAAYFNLSGKHIASREVPGGTRKATIKDVREAVWEQLPAEQKDRIDGGWKDAKVSKTILNGSGWIGVKDKSYEGKEVYVVDFPTKSRAIPNNMIVFADVDTLEFIGYGLID